MDFCQHLGKLLLLLSASAGFCSAFFFHKKESDMFSRDQITGINCSEPICVGHFRDIYCQGPIIWASWHFGMQDECPGSRMRYSAKIILHNFDRSFSQEKLSREAFVHFCEENFDDRPYLVEAHLEDWTAQPNILGRINDSRMRMFAEEIHKIWPKLARRFVDDVQQNEERYPFLAVPNAFIVPGNNVQMYYYWDTFWIIKGLLLSDMAQTARGILRNMAHVMKVRGHIPNSGNIQFSRRSQPPLFTQMVADFFDATNDRDLLAELMPALETELNWWRQNRTVTVRMDDGDEYVAYLYRTLANCPRPESLMLDYYFARESPRDDFQFIWSSTNSACESGWDFSTRWFSIDDADEEMEYTRKGIRTNEILPVDLNVLMALNYRTMSRFFQDHLNNQRKAKYYELLSNSLIESMDVLFRDRKGTNKSTGVWFDFDLPKKTLRKRFFPINILPLLLLQWSANKKGDCAAAIDYMKTSGALQFKGGLPVSLSHGSVEKWDWPTGEPRLMHLTVLSLLKCSAHNAEAWPMAKRIADGLLNTAFNGLFHPRRGMPAQLWEKYDVRFDDGRSGFEGDYEPQTGYAGTNGALMDLIRIFYAN